MSKHKLGDVDFPQLKQDPPLHRWPQCRNVFEVLLADSQMDPWKMAPVAPSDAELDVEHDCSFFSSSFRGLSRIQPYPAISSRPSVRYQRRTFRQARIRKSDVQQSVIEGRLSLIQGEQHVVKGLYVACHLVTLQCLEAPDCGLLF